MSRVSSITRVVSRTGHEDTQVVVDVSSSPDPDYIDVPKEVMYGCIIGNTSRTAGLYGYKGYTKGLAKSVNVD